jgi:hypothetical protein
MTQYTKPTYLKETRENISQDFGVTEPARKTVGPRRVGASVMIMEADFAINEGGMGGYSLDPGHYFILRVGATRDGIGYGASSGERFFKTRAEVDAAVAKYFKDARKRAVKKFGPVA